MYRNKVLQSITIFIVLYLLLFHTAGYSQAVSGTVLWLAKPQFDEAYDFSQCVGWIKKGNKFGFITKDGRVVEQQFDTVYNFCDGIAKVKVGGKWGYIDKEGRWIAKPQFDTAYNFSDGIAVVVLRNRYMFLTKEGKLSHNQFDFAWDCVGGMAKIKKDGKIGYVNTSGDIVVEPTYDDGSNFSEDLAAVKMNGKWGYIKNPLTVQQQLDAVEAGVFVGSVKDVIGGEVIVAGPAVQTIHMFDKLCIHSDGKMIILNALFHMMTIVKCKIINGNASDIARGMKVYKYTGGKKRRGEKESA